VLRKLRVETSTLRGNQMQIPPDQGALLGLIVELMVRAAGLATTRMLGCCLSQTRGSTMISMTWRAPHRYTMY
jgi:hypothetical protein